MILGPCPNCDKPVQNKMPDVTPVFERVTCNHCDKPYWLFCTRALEPIAWTEEDFLKEYDVNQETKSIKKKNRKQL